jgi:uncharacterized protein (TIGR03000 family)
MSEEKKASSGSTSDKIWGGLGLLFLVYCCVGDTKRDQPTPPTTTPITHTPTTYTSTTPSWQSTAKTPSWNLPDKSTAGLPAHPSPADLLKAKEKSGGGDPSKTDSNPKTGTDTVAGGKDQPKLQSLRRNPFVIPPKSDRLAPGGTSTVKVTASGGEEKEKPQEKAKPKLKVIVAQDDAELILEGDVTKPTGTVREFSMPDLQIGKQYEYKLTATWKPSNSATTLSCTKTVVFKGGEGVEVDLTKPDPTLATDISKAIALPEKTTPASGVDEELLILFMVEHYFAALEDAPAPEVVNRLVVLRKRLVELKERAKVADHDKLLIDLCQDMRDGIDSIFTFLENIGAIERGLADRAASDKATAAYNAGYLGGSAYADGASGGEAILAAGLLYFLQESAAESRRDAAKQAAFKRENDRMQSALEDCDTKVKVKLAALAEKRKWGRGVLDLNSGSSPDLKKARQGNDIAKLKSHYEDLCKKQPTNPFPKAELLWLKSLDPKATPESILKLGKECFLTTTLFPDNAFYDPVKAELVFTAAMILDRGLDNARTQNIKIERGVLTQCHEYWELAIRLGGDKEGIVRENMMWQLTKHGAFEPAFKVHSAISGLRDKSPDFHYYSACLQTCRQKHDDALTHVEKVITLLRPTKIALLRDDPNLMELLKAKPTEYRKLFTPKFSWGISYGVFDDDIWIKNESAFPLTDVELTPVIIAKGKEFTKTLKVGVLPPGQTHKWADVFSIPDSKADKATATMKCEQQR